MLTKIKYYVTRVQTRNKTIKLWDRGLEEG